MGTDDLELYLDENKKRQLNELMDWLSIPSISTLPERKDDMIRAAGWLADHLKYVGLNNAEVIETGGHPLVWADWLDAGDARPTVLIYGHYDVQPVDPLDKWETPPFTPTVRNGKRGEDLYARGACDDKGQVFVLVKALEAMLFVRKNLPVNIKMIIEGEEEIGSPAMSAFVEKNAERLAADICLISDTAILAPDKPSIDYGLRGIWLGELAVKGPAVDLHSGAFGGAVHNPNQALAELIATLHDASGRVAVNGFYDDVRVLSDAERERLAGLPPNEAELAKQSGAPAVWGEPGYSIAERIGARPTLEINGMWGGYTGQGFKTVIPSEARAKISCRLVPDQDPKRIGELLRAHFEKVVPSTVSVELQTFGELEATLIDPEIREMQAAIHAYEKGFGEKPLFNLCGGGIPIVSKFQKALKAPVVLMGFGLPDDNAHAPNERIHLPNFFRGIRTAVYFLEEIGG
jgi:acetylornithine deacetylase/succinyl-diaminopimelate desuccinylase-like protein